MPKSSRSNNMKSNSKNTSSKKTTPSVFLIVIICTLAAFFYFYEFIIRVMPSAIATELMHSFNIRAMSLGWLSALFFYGYMPMQVPCGLLLDHYGARRLLSLTVLLCAAATALFALTSNFQVALCLRFIMGAAAAFAFTGAAFTASHWISTRYFAMYTGLIQTLGCVGAILGQAPIAYLAKKWHWRQINLYLAACGAIAAVLIYLIVRDRPANDDNQQQKQATKTTGPTTTGLASKTIANTTTQKLTTNRHWQRLRQVFSNQQNRWIGLYAGLSWASINLFAALWGIPYLMRYLHINAIAAGTLVASCWLGVAIGSPIIGLWSKHSKDRLWAMLFCILCGLVSSTLILLPHFSATSMAILLFILGLSAGGQPISFDLIYDNNFKSVIGTAIGFNNMCVITGGLLLQPLAGFILQWGMPHTHNIREGYPLQHFQHALLIMPICFALNGLFVIWKIKKPLRMHHKITRHT